MAVILAVAALVAIAAAMTLTGAESGAGASSAPPAAARNAAASPTTTHPSLTTVRTHLIQRGDTLRSLARRFYGDEGLWPVLFEANRKRVAAPEDLRIGTEIVVPAR
ncbi:MAG TPA: LysM peptidoglycan-binding domain-containing protein [Candidatus Limnocylindria bacterium]